MLNTHKKSAMYSGEAVDETVVRFHITNGIAAEGAMLISSNTNEMNFHNIFFGFVCSAEKLYTHKEHHIKESGR